MSILPTQGEEVVTQNGGFETGSLTPWIGQNVNVVDTPSYSGLFSCKLAANGLNAFLYQEFFVQPLFRWEISVALTKLDSRPNPPISMTVYVFDPTLLVLRAEVIPYNSLAFGEWRTFIAFFNPPIVGRAYFVINALPTPGTSPVCIDDANIIVFER